MSGGLFKSFSKVLDVGATYLQHHQLVERLRGMQLEEAKTQLATYIRGMSSVGFNGVKLALTLFAKNSKDANTGKLLNGLLEALDSARKDAEPSATSKTATASPLFDTPPMRSFEDDLTLVNAWYELEQDDRIAMLGAHLVDLTPDAFNAFRAHVSQMIDNLAEQIRRHEDGEDNAWGGFAEDRMSYMLARLQSGQRDPAYLAQLHALHGYGNFYTWVGQASDLVREERERHQRESHPRVQPAPADSLPDLQDPQVPVHAEGATADDSGGLEEITMLREFLQQGLISGAINPERRVSYERLLDKLEGTMAQLNDPGASLNQKSKLLDRYRGLMAEFQSAYLAPGPADRLEGLREDARARTLETCIAEMKGVLYRELAQSPPQHTAERAGELMGDLTRAHQEVAELVEDEGAIAFERAMLRITAQGLHDFIQREHLMLVRPLWQCAEVMPSAHGLFYSGGADLKKMASAVAKRLRLDIPSIHGQYYGQARWDALRACHAAMFDLRGYRPGLAQSDSAAASALAGTAYELGLACSLGKPIVVVTRPGDPLPFDVDIAPCEILGDTENDKQMLADALDRAWYGRQRTTGASGLAETFTFLDQITRDHPRRKMLEATGLLDAQQVDDAIGFTGIVKLILRERGLGDLQAIFPAWAGRYPDAAMPTVFHVMPFSEPWSNDTRDTVRATCTARGYSYRRGDEADEGRIIQAIWDDICGAHIVLVDLTGLNLNVLMELGMAHALGRTVLAVRQAGLKEPLPRNIEKLRVLDYDSPSGLSRLIESRLGTSTS